MRMTSDTHDRIHKIILIGKRSHTYLFLKHNVVYIHRVRLLIFHMATYSTVWFEMMIDDR